jgi:hypothetical protein
LLFAICLLPLASCVPLSFLLHPIYEQNAAKKKSRKEKLDQQVKALDLDRGHGRAGRGRIREATSASVIKGRKKYAYCI